MIADFIDSRGPSRADLRILERIGRHRRALESQKPEDEHQTVVYQRLMDYFDVMEEVVCEEGPGAPFLVEAWQRVAELEARYSEGPAETRDEAGAAAPDPGRQGTASRRRRGSRSRRRSGTARRSCSSPRAA